MLKIENITYGYNAMHNVLENFSLNYEEPGIYGLLGKNGTDREKFPSVVPTRRNVCLRPSRRCSSCQRSTTSLPSCCPTT